MGQWHTLIDHLSSNCEFRPPATPDQIAAAEAALCVTLPDPLKSLLLESNGIVGETGEHLIWKIERIQKDNLSFRQNFAFAEQYMPFDPLFFFADAGNGDQFAYRILAGVIRYPDIYVWNHEDDSRVWVAQSLDRYLTEALKRTLRY
jgi:hypothetical protein